MLYCANLNQGGANVQEIQEAAAAGAGGCVDYGAGVAGLMELMLDIGVAATRDALVGLVCLDMLTPYLLSDELAARICPLCLAIDAGESHMVEHSEEEVQLLHQHWAETRPDMVIDLYEDEEEDDD